ncbi:nuclear transport factor 2 family protein [Rhodoferax saidenbachensis]|uniref:SnoaL-like aldol condensation-catalyzing enzyme n=1 Tax=Rhodoferax saidenbachensis TaxID=1484693 RepID=A0ABU1ZPD6_9BURK|nr:nuclear transport factor 2 family protein [Rhodoferax saidenbachensis]MDR7307402.1 putative SnoaL-like aldol condensation-catalyzing enzyme [Rhodoferax saidenbachensis]
MKPFKTLLVAASLVALFSTSAFAQTNKEIVVAGMKGLFITRDASVIDKYWSPDYVQHNPMVPNGSAVLKGFVSNFGPDFKYEPGMVVAEGDLVMMHGRYTGIGPKAMIGVDIFRLANGKIVEHWDILQEEVVKTVSGNLMFSNPQK